MKLRTRVAEQRIVRARSTLYLKLLQTQNNIIFCVTSKHQGVLGWCSAKGTIKRTKNINLVSTSKKETTSKDASALQSSKAVTKIEQYRKTVRVLAKIIERKTTTSFRHSLKAGQKTEKLLQGKQLEKNNVPLATTSPSYSDYITQKIMQSLDPAISTKKKEQNTTEKNALLPQTRAEWGTVSSLLWDRMTIIPIVRTTLYFSSRSRTIPARTILSSLLENGIDIHRYVLATPVAFNGCRPKKLSRT